MKNHIDPVTLKKLEEFSNRRKRLLKFRGLCAFIISTVSIFSILAAVDTYVLLADGIRSFLTFSGWLTVAGITWGFSLRHLFGKPSRRELARYIETQEPGLREDLLSAIELGSERSSDNFDSEVFRNLLQKDVANRIKTLDIDRTLPIGLIAKWLRGSIALAIVFLGLFFIPDFGKNFGTAIGRTMFGANIARVSGINITILAPDSNKIVPFGESVRVRISLTGDKDKLKAIKKVILESESTDKQRNRATMNLDEEGNYVARLNIGESDMKFRIQAGPAQDKWYTLGARARPGVKEFSIAYNYPEYTQMPVNLIKNTKGDIDGLEGSILGYTLKTNQSIAEAELRLDLATKQANHTIPLQPAGKDRTILSVPDNAFRLIAPGTYRVHLVSEETGFINKYSPKYEISVNPDQVPRIQIIQPSRNLLLPADEILGISGECDDDLPLQRVELQVRVNNGRWEREVLYPPNKGEKLGKKFINISHNLDLLKHTLSAGDRVKLKLVAFDLKGQKSDSNLIELSIISRGFEASRIETIAAQNRILILLDELTEQIRPIADEANKTAEHLKKLKNNDPQSVIHWAGIADLSNRMREETSLTLEKITKIARTLPKGAPALQAEYIQRALGRVIAEYSRQSSPSLESAREAIDPNLRKRYLDESKHPYNVATGSIWSIRSKMHKIAAANLSAVMTEDLHTLAKQQQEILPEKELEDTPLTWKRLARREKAAINQASAIERSVKRFGHLFENHHQKSYQKLTQSLIEKRENLEEILGLFESGENADPLNLAATSKILKPANEFKAVLLQFLSPLGQGHRSHGSFALNAHRSIAQETQDDFHSIYRIAQWARELRSNQKAAEENRIKGNPKQAKVHTEKIRHLQRLLSQFQWPTSVGRLEFRAVATESRKDSDNRFAKDAGMTARALGNLANRFSRAYSTQGSNPDAIILEVEQIAGAFRKLEYIHMLVDLQSQTKEIAHQEKWKMRHPASLTIRPIHWRIMHASMPQITKNLRDARLNVEAVKIMSNLPSRPYTKDISTQLGNRSQNLKNLQFKPQRMTGELELVNKDIAQALRLLAPEAEEARKLIEAHTPSIADMAR
ncbi:MAG: hypothetical protein HN467_14765 [Opitutae bacterium]|nr:hypothetical protein [Opitutae bacterium]